MWVVFNEGQGQHDTGKLVDMVRKLDPTRLVNQASGGGHHGVGDVFDIHPYPAADSFQSLTIATRAWRPPSASSAASA